MTAFRLSLQPEDSSLPSFRGDAQHRTTVRNCAPENLEIPGSSLTRRPGMTNRPIQKEGPREAGLAIDPPFSKSGDQAVLV
jgi:hypothetical protein